MSDMKALIGSGINALTEEFQIITHNLANVSTTGYKRKSNAFSRLLESGQQLNDADYGGALDLNSILDFSQGGVTETGRSLDLALYGNAFFVIETPDGPRYTRNGMFQLNQNGQIVDAEGRALAGEGGPITIPANVSLSQINVSNDGNVTAGDTIVGKLRLVDFGDDQGKLVSAGMNYFHMPDENVQPTAAENAVVKQGFLESSNVKMVEELMDMIMVTRLYEANMELVTAKRESTTMLINVAMG